MEEEEEEEDSEEASEADGAEASGAIGMVAVVATTKEDTSAAIARLLIIDLSNMWTDETDCLSSGLAVIFISCH